MWDNETGIMYKEKRMTEKKGSSDDELLYKLLSEKLHRHYCGDEGSHMTDEEVQAVLNVMETIKLPGDSYFNADAAWERFRQRYMSGEAIEISAEFVPESEVYGLAGLIRTMEESIPSAKLRKKRKGIGVLARVQWVLRSRATRWTAITVAAAGIMFAGLNVGTYATARMGFFEFISQSGNSWEFFISGEREEEQNENGDFDIGNIEKKPYESWEEVREEIGENMLVPEYIPAGFELKLLKRSDGESQGMIVAAYDEKGEREFLIRIRQYIKDDKYYNLFCAEEDYSKKVLPSGREIYYSQQDDDNTVWFFDKELSYCLDGNLKLDEMIMIIENLK